MEVQQEAERERRLRWSLGVLHFLVIAAFTFARVVRDGSLLSRVSVEWVPYLTVAVLLAMAALTPLVHRLTRARDPLQAFARVAIATGVSLLAWELLLRDRRAWSAAGLYVWVGAYGPLLVAQFWLVVHGLLDAQQARRLIGWVGAAGILGGVAAGVVATGTAATLTLAELLGLTAFIHLVAGAIALGGRAPSAAQEPSSPGPAAAAPGVRQVLQDNGYARLLALVVVLGAVTGGVIDYQFKLALQQQSTDAADLGRWLGLFNVAASVLALLAQLATGVLLAQFGSRLLAFVLPGGVITGAVAGLFVPAVWPVVLTRVWETANRHSLARTAHEFFFFPLQGERRTAMKRAAEGFLTRAGEVIASLLLVTLAQIQRADLWHLSLVAVAAGAAWVVVLGWLAQAYGPALSSSLDQLLRPRREDARADVERALAVPELVTLLRSHDERHVVFALDELTSADPERARREARPLLGHRSPAVRSRARRAVTPVRRASETAGAPRTTPGTLPLLLALRSGDPARVAAACDAVASSLDRHAVPVLLEGLTGPTRAAVSATLVRMGDAIAGTLGDALVDTRVPVRLRREIALVLGRMPTPTALTQLARVSRDAPRTLRSIALRGLNAARKRGVHVPLDEARVREDIEADLIDYRRRVGQHAALRAHGGDLGLLPRAVSEAVSHAREHVFRRLALLYPAREMLRAHRGLVSADERIRAFALEYLEATLTPSDRDLVLPVLREVPPDAQVPLDRLLRELADDADDWIATLAVHAIGVQQARTLRDVVEAMPEGDVVRQETVRWALARL